MRAAGSASLPRPAFRPVPLRYSAFSRLVSPSDLQHDVDARIPRVL